jgi:hypothetical protein
MMIGYFPDSFPDEAFYSICSRYREYFGFGIERMLDNLFGNHDLQTSLVMFPTRLNHLLEQLSVIGGPTGSELIEQHSFSPLYRIFMPSTQYNMLIARLYGNSHYPITRELNILVPVLRYCPLCVNEDYAVVGEAYWHRSHQIKGIGVCSKHLVYLEETTVKTDRPKQMPYLSAQETCIDSTKPRPINLHNPHDRHLYDLSITVSSLLNSKSKPNENQAGLRTLYRRAIITRKPNGVNRQQWISTTLPQKLREKYGDDLLIQLDCNIADEGRTNWIPKVISKYKLFSPIKHVLLIGLLGYTVDQFLSLSDSPEYFGKGPWPCLNPKCSAYRKDVIAKCDITRRSRNLTPGHDTKVANGSFECPLCGFRYVRIGPEQDTQERFTFYHIADGGSLWDEEFASWWNDPTKPHADLLLHFQLTYQSTQAVAARLNLLERPSIIIARTRTRLEELEIVPSSDKVENCKRILEATVSQKPNITRDQLYTLVPDCYSMVRSTERAWLEALTLHLPRTLDLQLSDEDMAIMVKDAATKIKNQPGKPKRVTCPQIYAETGIWHVRHGKLDNFPLTRAAVDEVVETSLECALRRLAWAADEVISNREFVNNTTLMNLAGGGYHKDNKAYQEALRTTQTHIEKTLKKLGIQPRRRSPRRC